MQCAMMVGERIESDKPQVEQARRCVWSDISVTIDSLCCKARSAAARRALGAVERHCRSHSRLTVVLAVQAPLTESMMWKEKDAQVEHID